MKYYLLFAALIIAKAANAQTYDVVMEESIDYQEVSNEATSILYDEWSSESDLLGFNIDMTVKAFSHEYDLNSAFYAVMPRGFIAIADYEADMGVFADAFYLPTKSGEGSSINTSPYIKDGVMYMVAEWKNAYIEGLPEGDNSYLNYQIWISSLTGAIHIRVGDCQLSEEAQSMASSCIYGYAEMNSTFGEVYETMFLVGSLDNPSLNRSNPFAPFGRALPSYSAVNFVPVVDTGIEEEMTQDIWDEMKYSPAQPLAVYDTMGNMLGDDLNEVFAGRETGARYIIRYGDRTFKVMR
jgi:hypothetical protein